jgi:hypothetical protein
MNVHYVVRLADGVWLATGQGDPPRTLVLRNARMFSTMRGALTALKRARRFRPFSDAEIVEVKR